MTCLSFSLSLFVIALEIALGLFDDQRAILVREFTKIFVDFIYVPLPALPKFSVMIGVC